MVTTSTSFPAWLATQGPRMEAALSDALKDSTDSFPIPRLQAALRHALLGGGKRVRPALCLLSSAAYGGEVEAALPAALACEMVHAYSLVHDDLPCMDDDVLRRGRPTVHVAFDEATAVLTGDALQALAFETLAAQTDSVLASRQALLLARASGAAGMVGGQQLDMDGEGQELSLGQVLRMQEAKTGALLSASIQMGVVAAGMDPDPWRAYAKGIGFLFQWTDDILDSTASTEALGKTAGKDAQVEKATIVRALGLDGAKRRVEEEVALCLQELDRLDPPYCREILADLPDFLRQRGT